MKSKKRKDDEITRLQKEVRELKSLNRSLMKRLKKVDRHVDYEEFENKEEDTSTKKKDKRIPCPKCGQPLESISVANRTIKRCTDCKYRSKAERD